MVLGHSLRRAGWDGETVAVVTEEVGEDSRHRLSRFWQRIVEVSNIANPNSHAEYGLASFDTTYTKLHLWALEEYKRLIYLDADAIVLRNIDELKEAPSFAAAPCMWIPNTFNSGVMVLEPSRPVFEDMVSKIATTPSHDGGDQGFLNCYYPDWFSGPPERRLSPAYNYQQWTYVYKQAWKTMEPQLKILHFTDNKPWKLRRPWMRKLMAWQLRTFTKASREGPTPFDLWWKMHQSMEQS